jgi:predicted nucleic acid-binding protein
MKSKIVADTSALVSLEVVELVPFVLKYFDVIIPQAVKSELEDIAKYNDIHGAAAGRILDFVENKKITVENISGYEKHLLSSDLGESQALELANKTCADYLISDDVECFWYLENNFRKTVFSVFIVRLLCSLNEIGDDEGWQIIEKMCERRTWAKNIIYLTAKKFWGK